MSTTKTDWPQVVFKPQESVASQVRVATKVAPHWPLVMMTVETMRSETFVPPQYSWYAGASKVSTSVHSMVLFGEQFKMGGGVTTLTIWVASTPWPQALVAVHTRVAR